MQNPSPVNLRNLTQAILTNDCAVLSRLFSQAEARKIFSALLSAVNSGSVVQNETAAFVLRFLISQGIGVDFESGVLLRYAIEHEYRGLVEVLIRFGADTNIIFDTGVTPLQAAAACGSLNDRFQRPENKSADGAAADIISLLLAHGADINAGGVVCAAAKFRSLDVVKELIACGGSVNDRDGYGKTPLFFCGDAPSVVRFFITQGADVNARDYKNETPLMALAFNHTSDLRSFKPLVRAGADLNAQNVHGATALMHAAYTNKLPMVEALVEAGADCRLKDANGLTALDLVKESPYPASELIGYLEKVMA